MPVSPPDESSLENLTPPSLYGDVIRRLLEKVDETILALQLGSNLAERTVRSALSHEKLSTRTHTAIVKSLNGILADFCQKNPRTSVESLIKAQPKDLIMNTENGLEIDGDRLLDLYPGQIAARPGRPSSYSPTSKTRPVSIRQASDRVRYASKNVTVFLNTDDAESSEDEGTPEPSLSPFRGLERFCEWDREHFFGRHQQVSGACRQLLELVSPRTGQATRPRLLGLIGPSGIGKSSLLRAGLIPALGTTLPKRFDGMNVTVFTPQDHPMKEIMKALQRLIPNSTPSASPPRDLAGVLRQIDACPERPALVAIDQFEELFIQCDSREERTQFINEIIAVARSTESQVSFVIVLRDDYFGYTEAYPELNRLLAEQHIQIPVLSDGELREAIVEPLKRRGYRLEPSFVDWIIDEYRRNNMALPALQCDLLHIWRLLLADQDPQPILRQQGLGAALYRNAEKVIESLPPGDIAIAKKAFLSMLERQNGSYAIRGRTALEAMTPDGETVERVHEVLSRFAANRARLLVLFADEQQRPHARITHQIITTKWRQLAKWIAENEEFLVWRERLDHSLVEWDSHERASEYLLGSVALAEVRDQTNPLPVKLSPHEQEFIRLSKEQQQRNARRKRALSRAAVAAGLAFLIVAVMAAWNNFQLRQANQQREQTSAQYRLTSGLYWLLIAEENRTKNNHFASKLSAMKALGFENHGRQNQDSEFLTQHPVLLNRNNIAAEDREAYHHAHRFTHLFPDFRPVWHFLPGTPSEPLKNSVTGLSFSPDGRWLFVGTAAGLCQVSLETQESRWINLEGGAITWLECHPTQKRLYIGTTLAFYSLQYKGGDQTPQALEIEARHHSAAAMAPNGTLAIGFNDGRIVLVTDTGKPTFLTSPPNDPITALAFNSDGSLLVVGTQTGTARFIDQAMDGAGSRTLQSAGAPITDISLDLTSETLWIGTDGTYRFIKLEDQSISYQAKGLLGNSKLHWLPDSLRYLVATTGGTFHLGNPYSAEVTPFITGLINIQACALSPDAEIFALGGEGWGVTLIALEASSTESQLLAEPPSDQAIVAFNQGATSLALYNPIGDPQLLISSLSSPGQASTAARLNSESSVQSLALGTSDNQLFAAHADGSIREYPLDRLSEGSMAVGQVWAQSSDSTHVILPLPNERLATAHESGSIRLWRENQATAEIRAQGKLLANETITSLATTPDTATLIAGTDFGYLHTWKRQTQGNGPSWDYAGKLFGGDGISSLSVSPDGTQIASGSFKGTLQIWQLGEEDPLHVRQALDQSPIRALAFDPSDGSVVHVQRSLQRTYLDVRESSSRDYASYLKAGTLQRLGFQFLERAQPMEMINLPQRSHLQEFQTPKSDSRAGSEASQ